MWMLFADQEDSKFAGLLFLATLFGGAIQWSLGKLMEWRASNRRTRVEDDLTTHQRLERLVERLDKDRMECIEENRKLEHKVELDMARLREALLRQQIRAERAVERIKHMEVALENAKIPFLKWTEEPSGDTGQHPALPPSTGE